VLSSYTTFQANFTTGVGLICPSGKVALSGGWRTTSNPETPLIVRRDSPTGLDGWMIELQNTTASDVYGYVYTVCAAVSF
jgi:hypothetical protein